ncbi:response regulator [Leptospira sp. GIMC2001]|uniref:response regulator n=1 Tax=Leptospira sp. GIMC2001 TaxID=1513297 RepID=UPI0023495D4C|nr:response regulator transcription factor [Leptospira sp. GIMC2001]WCL49625.1 response regulator transcription factor [Leptospira sp. GIMC2001]
MSKQKYTAAIIDDNSQYREFIKKVLVQDPIFEKIEEYKSGEEFLSLNRDILPDLIFLDIHLPHLSGIDLLRIIRKRSQDAKVIMITNSDSEETIFQCIKQGALGYIYKMDVKSIKEVYDIILKGGAVFSPTIALRIANQIHQKEKISQDDILTDRERQILQLIIACKKDNDIADLLKISHSTVRFHVKNICQKFEAKNKMELTKIVRDTGWF